MLATQGPSEPTGFRDGPVSVETAMPLVDSYLAAHRGQLSLTERHDLACFCRWLRTRSADPDRLLKDFSRGDMLAFAEDQLRPRRGRRLEPSPVYRRLLALGRFLAWALRVGAVRTNPVPPERTRRDGGRS